MKLEPLTITAHLLTPPVCDRPLLLDSILYSGLGSLRGMEHPSGRADADAVFAEPLPLARVETPWGWWWAASQVTPWGREQVLHLNRAPDYEANARWTNARSLNHAAGPDKRLRVPHYYRPEMMTLTWTVVGDATEVARLIAEVWGVGRLVGHGHGSVGRWEIRREGPELAAYQDARVRHVPVALDRPDVPAITTRSIPLRPPYYRRREGVPCWQVVG